MLTIEPAVGVRPVLVIAIGNPSRGDDALGPLLAERLESLALPQVEVLTDFQLQIEHALDLLGRQEVIFVDARAAGAAPVTIDPLTAAGAESITTHALAPQALLASFQRLTGEASPRSRLLAIRGYEFELGGPLTAAAAANLDAAMATLIGILGATGSQPG